MRSIKHRQAHWCSSTHWLWIKSNESISHPGLVIHKMTQKMLQSWTTSTLQLNSIHWLICEMAAANWAISIDFSNLHILCTLLWLWILATNHVITSSASVYWTFIERGISQRFHYLALCWYRSLDRSSSFA